MCISNHLDACCENSLNEEKFELLEEGLKLT